MSKMHILDLPTEMFEAIAANLNYDAMYKLRLVCKAFYSRSLRPAGPVLYKTVKIKFYEKNPDKQDLTRVENIANNDFYRLCVRKIMVDDNTIEYPLWTPDLPDEAVDIERYTAQSYMQWAHRGAQGPTSCECLPCRHGRTLCQWLVSRFINCQKVQLYRKYKTQDELGLTDEAMVAFSRCLTAGNRLPIIRMNLYAGELRQSETLGMLYTASYKLNRENEGPRDLEEVNVDCGILEETPWLLDETAKWLLDVLSSSPQLRRLAWYSDANRHGLIEVGRQAAQESPNNFAALESLTVAAHTLRDREQGSSVPYELLTNAGDTLTKIDLDGVALFSSTQRWRSIFRWFRNNLSVLNDIHVRRLYENTPRHSWLTLIRFPNLTTNLEIPGSDGERFFLEEEDITFDLPLGIGYRGPCMTAALKLLAENATKTGPDCHTLAMRWLTRPLDAEWVRGQHISWSLHDW